MYETEGGKSRNQPGMYCLVSHGVADRKLMTICGQISLSPTDFRSAQVDFVPLSLRDVPLQKSTVEWADIGGEVVMFAYDLRRKLTPRLGLRETRQTLRETLEWPTRYAAIFAQSPLRLRSGYAPLSLTLDAHAFNLVLD